MATRRGRPLSALLSQILVAFTLEFDGEFERRMREAGYPGAGLSMVLWNNLIRFLAQGPISVRDLAGKALETEARIKFQLGCLERWGYLALRPDEPPPARLHRQSGRVARDGWGSGRGIRSGWTVLLTDKSLKAAEIWPPLFNEIEQRWRDRFGADDMDRLRQPLEAIDAQIELDLPYGRPAPALTDVTYRTRTASPTPSLPLPVLLSRVLLAFTVEFDRESRTPMRLCASTIRVLGEGPVPVSDLPRLTGSSSEASGIGWQIKPYVTVGSDPERGRGKVARLTPLGLHAQQTYHELTAAIEQRWQKKFGKESLVRLREALLELFVPRLGERLLLSEGLIPPEGNMRAGEQAPALGRRAVASAARQRMRDVVVQSELFQRDPAGNLPHYPLWDMNRGFGP